MTRRAAVALSLAALGGSVLRRDVSGDAPVQSAGANAPALKDWPTLDALAQAMVDGKLTPGLSLSVMHKGVMLYSKGFGASDIDSGLAVTPQTSLRIASITKQFTAAAILLLAEQGHLSVHDPLSKFLPDFPRGAEVSLRQLLSHTSGMGDYINRQDHTILTEAQTRDYTTADVLKLIRAGKPLYRFAPGLGWAYSNSGFTLLSTIVEHLSGQSFADFCRQHLFLPAGMNNTTIDQSCEVTNAATRGYTPTPGGFLPNLPVSPSFLSGAGAIRSTTEDLCRWHSALLNDRVLKPYSFEAMLTPALLKNGEPAWERQGSEPLKYGFGVGLGVTEDSRRYCTHGGRINGFTGHLRSFIDEQVTVAILYNCDGGGAAHFGAAQKALRLEASRLGLEEAIKT
ncbi:serine hydrolase [Asticcacaulis sp. AND118]|uniref:serine hydrolase domain-containing protein n=1 Tax=Asticcacaulis sp. AND118 TaxID=2840468 RepID=UPI001CFF81D1|nr:serine hydrolase domain-containing protein [Asticcacaulis sp. AND118]UDF02340.1 beta-lactamase family protein [Asticcacaulis sp. AND118]